MKYTREIELLREVAEAAQVHLSHEGGLSDGLDKAKRLRLAVGQWEAHRHEEARAKLNRRLQDTLDRWGAANCVRAYRLNVEQGEGHTVIEYATCIPDRHQELAIAAGEYWAKLCEQAD